MNTLGKEVKNIKTYEEINAKIRSGEAVVVTADEMIEIVESKGAVVAAEEIDVVTTGTFGMMCGSGAFLNFGHSDPPIKPEHVWLNDVHAYHGNAAADVYLGGTRMASNRPNYGGSHVLEELLKGEKIHYRSTAPGTDCYPRTELETDVTLKELNQAILCNPRNAYQTYALAVNTSDKVIYTYMGKLLPNLGNGTFGGAGQIAPLPNDPKYETIGVGTHIFLGGGDGIVTSEGTQHSPKGGYGNLMVQGDMKNMSAEFLCGAMLTNYGASCYVGIGVPIPILNERIAQNCAVKDEDLITDIVDYSTGTLKRPVLGQVSYAQLKSGSIELNGKKIRVGATSSLYKSKKIANLLKERIQKGEFLLYKPVKPLPTDTIFHPIREVNKVSLVEELMKRAIVAKESCQLTEVAQGFLRNDVNDIVVIDKENKITGFLTTYDLAKSIGKLEKKLAKDIMTPKSRVISIHRQKPIDLAARLMRKHKISALPVLNDDNTVAGILTSEQLLGSLKEIECKDKDNNNNGEGEQ